MELVQTFGAATLGVAYALAALITAYVGLVRPRIRLWYWLSVPAIIGLSGNQWWALAQHQLPNGRVLFGQSMALGVAVTRLIRPALVIAKDPYVGTRDEP